MRNPSLTDNLHDDLVIELHSIRDKLDIHRQLEDAALTLLGYDPDGGEDDAPAPATPAPAPKPTPSDATFTAEQAKFWGEVGKATKKRGGGGGKRADISPDTVREIRDLHLDEGVTLTRLARDYGFSRQTIKHIVVGHGWFGEIA